MNRLVNMRIENVSAVGSPANRRSFLVIKAEGDPLTFDDALINRRMYELYSDLGELYGALLQTLDSIRCSDAPDKLTAVGTALTAYLNALTSSMPDMIADLTGADEDDGDLTKSASALETALAQITTVRDRLQKGVSLMAEAKKPDAGTLTKLGHGIAAMFAKAFGADDATQTELDRIAKGDPEPVVDTVTQARLKKAEDDAAITATALSKANDDIKSLRDEASLRKFAEEVAGFKTLGLDPAKDAVLLKEVTEKLPAAQAERFREILKSAMAMANATSLLREVGSAGAGVPTTGAVAQLDTLLKAELAKSTDGKTSLETARNAVFQAHPGLYEAWRAETTVRT